MEHFPAMPTKRILPVVVYSGKFLVVAGGYGKGDTTLATVEVMDSRSDTPQWLTASSLPHPLSDASATACGDRVYLVGGGGGKMRLDKICFHLLSECPHGNEDEKLGMECDL